ncbi:hypothetical protein [Hymenobacter canadensis]|uniref:hypothetical protein n=1 Tax=Hymenobacter canadensis TaxID=2999067 RepID=UPI003D9C8095
MVGGAEVAHVARQFLLGALVVEAHQAGEYFRVGEVGGPVVGGGYGGIELLVQAQDHGGQALLVDGLLFGRGEGLAGAQLLHHVVEVGEGEGGVLGLLALAVGVELFGQLPDARLLLRRGRREGEF